MSGNSSSNSNTSPEKPELSSDSELALLVENASRKKSPKLPIAKDAYSLGVKEFREGHYPEAKHYFESTLNSNKSYSTKVSSYIALLRLFDGNLSNARHIHNQLVDGFLEDSVVALNTGLYHYYGEELYGKGDLDKAADMLNRALSLDEWFQSKESSRSEIHRLLALVYRAKGNYAATENNLLASIGFDENNAKAYRDLAILYFDFFRFPGKAKDFARIAAIKDDNLGPYFQKIGIQHAE